jgi:hypothetical protein
MPEVTCAKLKLDGAVVVVGRFGLGGSRLVRYRM